MDFAVAEAVLAEAALPEDFKTKSADCLVNLCFFKKITLYFLYKYCIIEHNGISNGGTDMNNTQAILSKLNNGEFDSLFRKLYGQDAVEAQRNRYIEAVNSYTALYGEEDDLWLFSAPGRTEIGGNHTDHNHGCVLAGSVNLDVIAVAAPTSEAAIHVKSAGYNMDVIDLSDLNVNKAQRNRSASLIRGVADRFCQLGYAVSGFRAYTTSNVLKGSGLSSSAAFEVLIGTILNHLFNSGIVDPVEIAKISQYAENVHFGKPCGLMDQMASSVGGIISIDFENTSEPIIKAVDFDFAKSGHRLCIVDVGGDHANLTHEYAAITTEMKQISGELGVSFLRETNYETLLAAIPSIRAKYGDRAVLRALHFFGDNHRVGQQVAALEKGDFETFKQLVIKSGHSSFEYLQNIYSNSAIVHQEISLALALAQRVLDGKGAWRVHGGGFGGTTQNFVPEEMVSEFTDVMESVFGKGSCHILSIRPLGGVCISK